MLHILLIGGIALILGLSWGAFFMLEYLRRAGYTRTPHDKRMWFSGTARATQVGGDHYRTKTIQPWDAMEAWMTPEQFTGFLRGNAIKYLARCDDKGGMEDIKKARHYIDKMLEAK